MSHRVSIVIATCGRPTVLGKCLRALGRQRVPAGVEMEILVAIDGGAQSDEYASLDAPEATRFLFLPRQGMGACRNAAIAEADGSLLIVTNDDTYPEPTWVAEHLTAQQLRHEPGLVVGLTQWRPWPDPTVFDALVRDTSMVFFFHQMQAGRTYGFRHAWGCNTSLPMSIARAVGGYEERLRPYGYEDLEFAFRVEQHGCPGVLYHPAALNLHDHRITWGDYCRREASLGRMAACLADLNPDCFEAIFHNRDAQALRGDYEKWLLLDQGDHQAAAEEMARWAARPLAEIEDWPRMRDVLYQLHLPVKRRCFREGFVSGSDLCADDQWLERISLHRSCS